MLWSAETVLCTFCFLLCGGLEKNSRYKNKNRTIVRARPYECL
uniref:Uncharacterized protein n=1 Tax=Anopheles dirus TaxID=7168 RepID=A0A182NY66_9DIPT